MSGISLELKPVESLLFRSDLVAVGSFRCPAAHPLFRDSGPCNSHTFVFPRTMTAIRHEGGPSFVGNPATVSFYNRRQVYFRTRISDADASDWFVVADDVLAEVIARVDPSVEERPERPFRFAHGPSDARTYLEQRRLFERIASGQVIDALDVEERVIAILRRVIGAAYGAHDARPVTCRAREHVERARLSICRGFTRNATLREIASEAGASPYHLCRAFRALTGETMTSYRHSLRLRVALGRLRDRRTDLTELALDLGYDSHSHFTRVFRRAFGVPPSAVRAIP